MASTPRRAPRALALLALASGCCPADEAIEEGLLFQSGFEPDTEVLAGDALSGDLVGAEVGVERGDWEADLDGDPRLGIFSIQYQGGTPEERWIALEADPEDPANTVLGFHLAAPNVPEQSGGPKARIQANLYGNRGLMAFSTAIRMRPGPAFAALEEADEAFDWLTLAEFWNDADWTREGKPFRITLSVVKADPAPGSPLRLEARAQRKRGSRWETLWSATDPDPLRPEQWTWLEIRLREGGPDDGRFALLRGPTALDLDLVIDVRDSTRHPDRCQAAGFEHINPFKLYTSAELVEGVRQAGLGLDVLWDDWTLRAGWIEP